MTWRRLGTLSLLLCAAAVASACEISVAEDSADAGEDASEDADTLTYFRFAALSPDAPAVDFCVADYGSSNFSTPVLASIAEQLEVDGSGGLSFGQVSVYMTLPSNRYVVRVIEAGATDCYTTVIGDTTLDWFAEDAYHTVAIVGDLSVEGTDPDASVVVFEDDAAVATDYAKLRFIHAAPGLPAMDLGLGSVDDDDYDELFTGVEFGSFGSTSPYGTPNSHGYLRLTPASEQPLELHANEDETEEVIAGSTALTSDTLLTLFVVGGKTDDTSIPAHLLLCDDKTGSGYLGTCAVVSEL